MWPNMQVFSLDRVRQTPIAEITFIQMYYLYQLIINFVTVKALPWDFMKFRAWKLVV